MAAGDIKYAAYPASANLGSLTALNSLASSASWIAGYEGEIIDNTANLYSDYAVTVKIVTGTSPTANPGEIRLYFVAMLDDLTWPDVFDGTASAETITNAYIRDAICKWGTSTQTNTTSGVTYYLHVPSLARVFNYALPAKCVPFITHNTGVALAGSGHQITIKGSYLNVAAS